MTRAPKHPVASSPGLPRLPRWVASGADPSGVGFAAGAGFALLDLLLRQDGAVPLSLLANRLALKAAAATSRLEGRLAREAAIRDAYHLTPPDAEGRRHWGPDGEVLAFWRKATRAGSGGADRAQVLAHLGEAAEGWLAEAQARAGTQGPLVASADILRRVLRANDRAERMACLLSDLVLADYFGWARPLPLTALHLSGAAVRGSGDGAGEAEADLAVQKAIAQGAQTAFRLATTLARKAAALRAVAPRLRARGSGAAVALFLSEDAVAPSGMLSPVIQGTRVPMSGRAARRLCDRLVELGVVTELTGRATFRLYGVAQ